ncbi:MAG: hypothetical protein Q9172_000820 [Xanthocarpia lactea]
MFDRASDGELIAPSMTPGLASSAINRPRFANRASLPANGTTQASQRLWNFTLYAVPPSSEWMLIAFAIKRRVGAEARPLLPRGSFAVSETAA